ncbi:SemiSWEET transporter [Methylococcus mesophilus]|uniref:SemiSWEET transporter n=1 Tax=Methylococcus mesophilus TaxID=2993564 RepID=UPI00224B2F53|nr:SemiSWEET transporter [Methylococcus mesophilus]UZR29533.1 SemiSWEET transporter [Methylococcus mesophilus]
MEPQDLLGSLAGTLTTVSFVPQVWKLWKSRSAEDISFGMFSIFAAGVLLWLVYGIMIHAVPIILANSVSLVLVAAILVMKIAFRS